MHSRYEIYLERYAKEIATEGKLALSIARVTILPAAYRYQHELASTAAALIAAGKQPDTSLLDRLTGLIGSMEKANTRLQEALAHHPKGDVLAHARHYRDEVVPAMLACREVADEMETIIADDIWPLPTYREMLFTK
jgi:glutamine synthetase